MSTATRSKQSSCLSWPAAQRLVPSAAAVPAGRGPSGGGGGIRSAEGNPEAGFLGYPLQKLSRCRVTEGAACLLHLLLCFIGGRCSIAAHKSNVARSKLYSFLDQLLMNHSIFVLITRPFLSELFTTLPFHGSSPGPLGVSQLCLQTAAVFHHCPVSQAGSASPPLSLGARQSSLRALPDHPRGT